MDSKTIPLGFKFIWFNQALNLSGLVIAVLSKPAPVVVGPWIMPPLLSNFYMAFMIVSQGAVILELFKFKRSVFRLLICLESLGLLMLAMNMLITPDMLDVINQQLHLNLTLKSYRLAILPAIGLQVVILVYIISRRHMFKG